MTSRLDRLIRISPPRRLRAWLGRALAYARAVCRPDHRLQQGILLTGLLVLGLLWGGLALYLANRSDEAIGRARQNTANLALAFEQQTERTIRGVDQVMLFVKSDYERDPEHFDLQAWLAKAVFLRDLSLQISIADATGLITMSSLGAPTTAVSLKDRPHFRVHAERRVDGLFVSVPVLGRVSGKWSVQMTRRLNDREGHFAGVIVISLDPLYLSGLFANVDLGSKGALVLVGTDGVVRARAPMLADQLGRSIADSGLFHAMTARPSGTHVEHAADGSTIQSYRRVDDLQLVVTVSVDQDEVLAPVAAERRTLLLIVIPLSVLLVGLAGGFLAEIERRQRHRAQLIRQSAALDHANRAVERANHELEDKVLARTGELEAKSRDLESTIARLTETQAELAAQEKMASLGRVVAGIAHEVNTPLGVAITAASSLGGASEAFGTVLAQGALRKSDLAGFVAAVTEATDMISANLARAAGLVRSFKQVAADQHGGEPRRIEIGAYLNDIMNSLNPEIRRRGHTLQIEAVEPIALRIRPDALWQVMSNLVMNALTHAYQEGQRGALRLTLAREGDKAVIRFRDDGVGMAPEVRENIFEPFFTTRRGNGGTGLGLSIVYGLVNQALGGQIVCHSRPGAGSEFVVSLPLDQAQPELGAAA